MSSSDATADVVVIGAGHNGLVAGCYLARAGLDVVVLEKASTPGGCIATEDLPDGRGRLEIGAYEHGGLIGSGVVDDLELTTRFGLQWIFRDELNVGLSDDGAVLPLHRDLEWTLDAMSRVVGAHDVDAYRQLAGWSAAAMALLKQGDYGPPLSLRELAALADATLGSSAPTLMRILMASASNVLMAHFEDPRLRAILAYPAVWMQQPFTDAGTGGAVLKMLASHGSPSARPLGGSRGAIDALVRCLVAAGGELRVNEGAERIEVASGRATAVRTQGGARIGTRVGVLSSIDAKRVFGKLVEPVNVPAALLAELRSIHVGRSNLGKIKVDAVLSRLPALPVPAGFERASILSPGTDRQFAAAFSTIALGAFASRPPFELAFPSVLDPTWIDNGRQVMWLSSFVPWELRDERWDSSLLERAADDLVARAEATIGGKLEVLERRVTGPREWLERTGNAYSDGNHISMAMDQLLSLRPTPSLSGYKTPIAGLYLSGAGTHPGGGVSGAPGRNAARRLLAENGHRPRRLSGARLRRQAAMARDAMRAARRIQRAL